jgi:peptide subunit release factor 1 (eRF1)
VLTRGLHLHVLRKNDETHGPQGEAPPGLHVDNAETVGSRPVEVDYPEERASEDVARLCPYCQTPFKGKNGVLIHLGQVAGRKNHPGNASVVHEPSDFPVVELDEDENVVAVVEGHILSSVQRPHDEAIPVERVYRYIADLVSEGRSDEAKRARQRLLDKQ